MTSYINSESCTFVHPRSWASEGVGGICIRVATRTGFLVVTNKRYGRVLAVYLRGLSGVLLSLFLVEDENNVGNVAQSKKSQQKSQ